MNVRIASCRRIIHGIAWLGRHDAVRQWFGRFASSLPSGSVPKALLRNPAGLQCSCEDLLALLPYQSLDRQFFLHGLQSLLNRQPISLCPLSGLYRLVLCQTLVRQLRLKVTDRVLRLNEEPFSMFFRRGLRADGLSCGFELIAARRVVLAVIPMDKGDWHLAIADELTPLGMRPIVRGRRMIGHGSWRCLALQPKCLAHLRLGCTQAHVVG